MPQSWPSNFLRPHSFTDVEDLLFPSTLPPPGGTLVGGQYLLNNSLLDQILTEKKMVRMLVCQDFKNLKYHFLDVILIFTEILLWFSISHNSSVNWTKDLVTTLDSPMLVFCVCMLGNCYFGFLFLKMSLWTDQVLKLMISLPFFSATFTVSRSDWVLEEAVGKKVRVEEQVRWSRSKRTSNPGPRLVGHAGPQPYPRTEEDIKEAEREVVCPWECVLCGLKQSRVILPVAHPQEQLWASPII